MCVNQRSNDAVYVVPPINCKRGNELLKISKSGKNLPKQEKSGLGIQSKEIISMHKTLCTLNFGLSFPTYNFTENLDNVLQYLTHVYVILCHNFFHNLISDFYYFREFKGGASSECSTVTQSRHATLPQVYGLNW